MTKGKKVKVDRFKRRLMHELFSATIMLPLNNASSRLSWHLRVHKEAFTPGELEYLKKRHEELKKLSEDLHKIYFRLKF